MSNVTKILIAGVLSLVALAYWPRGARAAFGPLAIMPSISTSGGPLTEYGLHFDETADPEMGGYDYSAAVGTAVWVRGTAWGDRVYPARYYYWQESSCEVYARLQQYVQAAWWDYPAADIHINHVIPTILYSGPTQTVQYTGDWWYVTVGTVSTPAQCPPNSGDHSHLSGRVTGSGALDVYAKSNDTCWTNGTQCGSVMPTSKRLFSTCTTWSGMTTGKSGNYSQYYCATWQYETRTDQVPAFLY